MGWGIRNSESFKNYRCQLSSDKLWAGGSEIPNPLRIIDVSFALIRCEQGGQKF